MPRLSIRPRNGLGNEVSSGGCARTARWVRRARVRDRRRHRLTQISISIGIDQEAVEVREVAVAGNAGLAMFVIKLVVAGRWPADHFKSAICEVVRVLKVRISA